MRRLRRHRSESGSALVEVTWLSILLMVPLLYVVIATFEVQRGSFAVSAASRAAGRAYSMAPDEVAARERAGAAARLAMADQGLAAAPMELVVSCQPSPASCLAPGSTVTVRVTSAVDLPLVPSALGAHTPRIRVEALHRVPYGTFREDRG